MGGNGHSIYIRCQLGSLVIWHIFKSVSWENKVELPMRYIFNLHLPACTWYCTVALTSVVFSFPQCDTPGWLRLTPARQPASPPWRSPLPGAGTCWSPAPSPHQLALECTSLLSIHLLLSIFTCGGQRGPCACRSIKYSLRLCIYFQASVRYLLSSDSGFVKQSTISSQFYKILWVFVWFCFCLSGVKCYLGGGQSKERFQHHFLIFAWTR